MLSRTQFACEIANQHITANQGADNSELVKSYLATYCAYLFCSEMEERLEKILHRKLNKVAVGRIAQFISNQSRGMVKRTNKSDIAKFLGAFGEDAKDEFNNGFSAQDITKYMNVVTARHSQAHTSEIVNLTLPEIEDAIDVANRILVEVEELIDR